MNSWLLHLLHHDDVMEMIAEKNISLMVMALMGGDGLLAVVVDSIVSCCFVVCHCVFDVRLASNDFFN